MFKPGLSVLCLLAMSGSARTQQAQELPRVPYEFLRHGEDWSGYRGLDNSDGDWSDPLKFVALNEDGSVFVSFGGHVRARYEDWRNFNFKRPAGQKYDDSFVVSRALVHSDLHVGESFRVFVELKTAQATDRDLPGARRTSDMDTFEFQQVFFDYRIPMGESSSLTIRPGRQELLFGKQRIVSPLPWGNTLRHWQGVSTILDVADWNITAFYTEFLPVNKTQPNTTKDIEFWGAYATTKLASGALTFDTYALNLKRPTASFNGTSGAEDRLTLGVRIGGKPTGGDLDFDLEGAYQLGDLGVADISAYMVASEVGYSLASVPLKPRLWIGADLASGDDGGAGKLGTFNQLFPLGHAYLGYADMVGRQNSVDLSVGLSTKLQSSLTAAVALHSFRLENESDAFYSAGGGVVVPGGTSTSKDLGEELDVTLSFKADRHTGLLIGYSHFYAGDVLADAGSKNDIDFFYVSLQYTW